MRRLGLAALIILILPVIPVSAISVRPAAAVLRNSSEQTKASEGGNSTRGNLHGILEEHRDDAHAWKSDQPSRRTIPLPPKCPANVSETSPYMIEEVPPDGVHVVCKYRQPCDRLGTNLERLNSIRGLLETTKNLLNYLQVPYALYGGSAIGQQRCNDVLPWDSDCDVAIWMHDVYKIGAGDIGGTTQYAVMHNTVNSAIPYVVVDKSTGFYCDIFFMQYDSQTHQVGMAWPGGSHECPWMDRSFPFTPEVKRCNVFPMTILHPFSPCILDGVWHTCFKDQPAYLEMEYGTNVDRPNVTTQFGAHDSTKGTQMLRGGYS